MIRNLIDRARGQRRDAALGDAVEAVRRHVVVPGAGVPLVPYAEQVAGARALLRGHIAEMATGEGKTIAAGLAAACLGREGPVHVATANAYLARRDAGWLATAYAALGLTTGVITPELGAAERRRQYACDVVYGTLSEFGFDYLRDRLVSRARARVQARGLGALIVDEADLLLIDEARTPLVISSPGQQESWPDWPALSRIVEEMVEAQGRRVEGIVKRLRGMRTKGFEAAVLAAQMSRGAPQHPDARALLRQRPELAKAAERAERELRGSSAWMLDDGLLYAVDARTRTAYFTEEGQASLEQRMGPLFEQPERFGEALAALHQLLAAWTAIERDRDYLIRDGAVVLIEEATGRASENRRYMHGLHAAIETKELGAPLDLSETVAQISVQQFVRQYRIRAGMTGTASPAAEELARIYQMPVTRIPRHRPNRRRDRPPRLFRTESQADAGVVADAAAAHVLGRPVLIGTGELRRSERISALLTAAGLPHTVLNARDHAREAEIVARAGQEGAITVATSMAGRGTDIVLEAGLEERLVARAAAEAVGLASRGPLVVDCDSPRAFELLRAAHAQEPTLDVWTLDEGRQLMTRPNPPAPFPLGKGVIDRARPERGGLPEAPAAFGEGSDGCGRMPFGLGLLVLVVGSGDSRRRDDQLRGRAGRQGDEGTSRLYASLEDETLRYYGSGQARERALRALGRRPFVEGRAARRAIADAQRRAERMHAGQRRALFEFDLVVEAQRRAMLAAYERALVHPAPDELVEGFLHDVAHGEMEGLHSRTTRQEDAERAAIVGEARSGGPGAMPAGSRQTWWTEVRIRYGLPQPDPPASASELVDRLRERWLKEGAEAGGRWRGLARAALLRAARELWARHVDVIGALQREAPLLFGFLPSPPVVSFAREASACYQEYLWAVKSESITDLLTLPQPYERAPAAAPPEISAAATALLDWVHNEERRTAPPAVGPGQRASAERILDR